MTFPELPQFPQFPTIPGMPWETPPPSLQAPAIAAGVVTATKKGWNLIEYSDVITGAKVTFTRNPIVVALAQVRFGDFLPVDAPTLTVPSIKLPDPSKIIRIARVDFNSEEYCKLVASRARDRAKEMIGVPWPLSIIGD